MVVEEIITTTASPEATFERITDIERRVEWQLHLQQIEVLTPGPLGVETRFRENSKFGVSVLEVATYEPPERFAYRNVGGPFDVEVSMTVSATGTGARLTVKLSLEPRGFMKLLWPLVRLMAVPQVHRDFAELRQFVQGS